MRCSVHRKSGIKTMIKCIKKYINVIFLVYTDIFKCAPFATLFVVIYNFYVCVFPAIIVAINTNLFDEVETYIQTSDHFNTVIRWCVFLVVSYVIQKILEIVANALENIAVFEKYISKSRITIASKMSRLNLIDYENVDVREQQERANYCVEYEKISQLFLALLSVITNAVGVISVMVILAQYSILFLFISVLSVIPFFVVRKMRGNEFYYMKYMQAGKTRKLNYLWSLFGDKQAAKEMRFMHFGDYIVERWIECRDDINKEIWKLRVRDAISLLICENIETIGYMMGLICTMILVLKGNISIGVFCACIFAFLEVQNQTKDFLIQLGFIPEMVGYIHDYFNFVSEKKSEEKKKDQDLEHLDIKTENVCFRYPNSETNALKNVNLEIQNNDFVVIVGENGSGKTTLGKILMGLYQPSSGGILYNDVNLQMINEKQLYKHFTVVSQNFVKYLLTLRENVTISDIHNEPSDQKVVDLLKMVSLNELLDVELHQELGTEFGGIDLSGGQWQKLAIARSMYRNSNFLFFDEPTSAIDPITEQMILNNVISFAKGKTAVIVSHRVSLCNYATKIIVMRNGEVEAVGTHKDLMKSCQYYNNLYSNQSSWYQ